MNLRFTPRPQTRKLDSAQEKAVIAWIKQLDEAGRSPTEEMSTNCANSVLFRSHIDPETAPPTVSKIISFRQYKHWHGKAVNEAARLVDEIFDHREFLAALPGIRDQTFTSRTIRPGWAPRGIWPFKPAVVIEELEEICVDDGPEIEMIDELPESSPPPSVPSSQLSSPKTITRFRTSIQKAKTALEDIEMAIEPASPTLNSRLQKIFQGSLLQAELNAQREEDLNRYLQASQRRKRKTTRRRVQAGGPLYVKDDRKIEERKVEETKKA
ncbi:hypothetical protein VTO42DRAFT_5096 [Malbranchea cinnamomea]